MSHHLRRVLQWGVFGLWPILLWCETSEAVPRASNSDPPPGQVWLTLDRFERLPVETDEGDAPWLEVTHGLEAGQEIVVRGAAALSQRL